MVNDPSVFESLKLYCIYMYFSDLFSISEKDRIIIVNKIKSSQKIISLGLSSTTSTVQQDGHMTCSVFPSIQPSLKQIERYIE